MTRYSTLCELFKDDVPDSPPLFVKIYRDVDVENIWGRHFTFWNILLHDSDESFKAYLKETDTLLRKHLRSFTSAYKADEIRAEISNRFYSFLSELQVYGIFLSNSVVPVIAPPAAMNSKRKMDLSVNLDGRQILIEIITPNPPEKALKQGTVFTETDFGLSRKLANEIAEHFSNLSQPTNPTVIVVDGRYAGIDPTIVESTVEKLNKLTENDFPHTDPIKAKILAQKGRRFVSAVLLYKSNWGHSLKRNLTGPILTEIEISKLKEIFSANEV